jgi:hypothetical protein
MDWARTRGRTILSFLSDLGGALAFVTLAAGLIVAAITGAALLAWTALPQPFFALLVIGIALLAAGLVLHFLRGPLTPPVRPQQVQAAAEAADNPYSRAALLQRQQEEEKREEAEREEAAKIRRATRRIREHAHGPRRPDATPARERCLSRDPGTAERKGRGKRA